MKLRETSAGRTPNRQSKTATATRPTEHTRKKRGSRSKFRRDWINKNDACFIPTRQYAAALREESHEIQTLGRERLLCRAGAYVGHARSPRKKSGIYRLAPMRKGKACRTAVAQPESNCCTTESSCDTLLRFVRGHGGSSFHSTQTERSHEETHDISLGRQEQFPPELKQRSTACKHHGAQTQNNRR